MPHKRIRDLTLLRSFLGHPYLVIGFAFAVRLWVLIYWEGYKFPAYQDHFPFGAEIGRVARAIASGQGFSSPYPEPSGPTAVVPPVYPYLLAGVFRIFGIYTQTSAFMILTINSIFSALTCLTIFHIGLKTFGRKVALWASWVWVFFPTAIFYATRSVWSESLFAFQVSLLFLMALRLKTSNPLKVWFGFGLLTGVTALTSPAILSILPLLWLWPCYRFRQCLRRCSFRVIVAGVAFVLVVSPWFVRNYVTFGQFVFLRSNFGLEFRVANDEASTGEWSPWLHPATNSYEMERFREMGELAYMEQKKREALEFIIEHPGNFVRLTARRILAWWLGLHWQSMVVEWLSGQFVLSKRVVFQSLVFILMLVGIRLGFRGRRRETPLFAIVLLVYPLVYYVTHVSLAYSHAIEPLMIVLAVYAVSSGLSAVRSNPMVRAA